MQIGIILDNLDNSQLNYDVIKEFNKYKDKHSLCILYRNLTKCTFKCNFSILNYTKIFSSFFDKDSILIATDVDSAIDLFSVKNASYKVFYAHKLEFLQNNNFEKNYEAYRHNTITRSKSYAEAIKNYANVDVDVTEFNLERIIDGYKKYSLSV